MNKELIKENFKKLNLNCDVICFDTIESTNTTAKELAKKGIERTTLITSDNQTAGRGRLGRSFFSPKNSGIYMSLITNNKFKYDEALLITPAVAVAIAQTLIKKYNINAKIKWVNDIFVNSRKVCGILTETSFKDNFTNYIVIGVGINLIKPEGDFPKEISNIADAIFKKENAPEREVFLSNIVSSIIDVLDNLTDKKFVKEYQSLSFLDEKEVILPSGAEVKVIGIDNNCGLIVEHKDKTRETITSNDVTIKLSQNV